MKNSKHMKRIKYIDTAKGLLILMVVFIHVGSFYTSDYGVGGGNKLFLYLTNFSFFYFAPYFMGAFFLLHGYCSKKKRTFKETFEYGCKTLIIPVFFLTIWHIQWFCVSMFCGILIHSILRKYSDITNYIIYAVLLFIGVAINKYGWDGFYISHTLAFTPFLFLGEKIKAIVDSKKFAIVSIILCLIIWSIHYNKFMIPFITGNKFYVGFRDIPIFLIATICGSSSLFFVAKFLEKVDIFTKFGKHSLVIFLFHFNIILFLESKCVPFVDNMGILESAVAYSILFIVSLVGSYWVAVFIEKYCPWIIGKNWD